MVKLAPVCEKPILTLLCLFTILSQLPAAGSADSGKTSSAEEITVFAAASTTEVLEELIDIYSGKSGCAVAVSAASSGTLARQIELGADADVFISASKHWVSHLEAMERILDSVPFAGNRMAAITPRKSPLEPFEADSEANLPSMFTGRLSIADPLHAPAGMYAEELLLHYGWKEELAGRLQPAANVRAALTVVELGEAELGLVYLTDAMKSDNVSVLTVFPEASHSPIEYYCALFSPGGRDFLDFLQSTEAALVLEKHGFSAVNR